MNKDEAKTNRKVELKVYARFGKLWQRIVTKILRFIDPILNKNWNSLFLEKYGTLKKTLVVYNTLTNTGKAAEAGLVGNVGAVTAFGYLAVGLSNTAPDATQTVLISEIVDSGLARHAATVTRITTAQTNDTLSFLYAWSVTGSKTVEEIGIFNASSSGIMLGRALTGSLALVNGDQLQATYTIQYV